MFSAAAGASCLSNKSRTGNWFTLPPLKLLWLMCFIKINITYHQSLDDNGTPWWYPMILKVDGLLLALIMACMFLGRHFYLMPLLWQQVPSPHPEFHQLSHPKGFFKQKHTCGRKNQHFHQPAVIVTCSVITLHYNGFTLWKTKSLQ